MNHLPSNFSFDLRQAASIAERLHHAGYQALIAGGSVRDILLGRPASDYDIATDATPAQVTSLFKKTIHVGAHFGVVVVVEKGHEYEIATFRSDGDYTDGRRPDSVTFTDAEGDALRRDFTINGLFLQPETGKILDFVNGKADLQNRLIRAIGDPLQRFAEDKLRLLRAIRFAATLGFDIEEKTWSALCKLAPEIQVVSPERIRDELTKILLSPTRVRGFDLLDRSGLLQILLPEITALKGCEQPPEFHPEGDVFVHTRLMLALLHDAVSLPLVLGVLLHDIGKVPTQTTDPTGRIRFNGHETKSCEMGFDILKHLRFPNAVIEPALTLVRHHMAFKDLQQMRTAKLKRFLARETIADEIELHRVDCLSSHGLIDNLDFIKAKSEEFANEPLVPPPLVTGHDLINRGLRPGPLFKEILTTIETAQLEKEITDRESALKLLEELVESVR
ncbi:MAG: CCA tRNA nucleotidyltransferase [Chthoniobacterales bacterium]